MLTLKPVVAFNIMSKLQLKTPQRLRVSQVYLDMSGKNALRQEQSWVIIRF